MVKLLWDQTGERFYETGLDHGVLYLEDGRGVVWNGLVGVEEDFSDESSSPSYYDGVKHRDDTSTGNYTATLKAFTYPDEFLEFEGNLSLGNGLVVDDQAPKAFGLSYRTKVGNDVDGTEHGYRIHILYNLVVSPDSSTYETLNDSPDALEFSWSISSVPQRIEDYRPTEHIIFDTRFLNTNIITTVEAFLYGYTTTDPTQPSINDFINLIYNWDPKQIGSHVTIGTASLVSGFGDLTPSVTPGVYFRLPTGRLVPTETDGILRLDGQIITPSPDPQPEPEPTTNMDSGDLDVFNAGTLESEFSETFDGSGPSETSFSKTVDSGSVAPSGDIMLDGGGPSSTYTDTIDGGTA